MGDLKLKNHKDTMDHSRVLERLLQAHGAQIENLIWIAASDQSTVLPDFLYNEVDDDTWSQLFPDVQMPLDKDSSDYRNYSLALTQELTCNGKLGFLASVKHPVHTIRVVDGRPVSSSYSLGHCYVSVLYSDTLLGLIEQIEASAKEFFLRDLEKALKGKQS